MRWSAFAGLASLLVATAAHAGTSSSDAVETRAPRLYGWQNLAVQYGGQLLLLQGFVADNDMLMITGASCWILGGSVVHAAHGNAAAAIASPFLQLALPSLGLLLVESNNHEPALLLMFTGTVVAPLVDGLVLGWERPRESKSAFQVVPNVARDRFGLTLSRVF